MKKLTFIVLIATAVLVACQSKPTLQTGPNAEVIDGNLVRVDHSRADQAYIDPNANFRKYTAIMITPLGVDNVEIIQPSSSFRTAGNRNWELSNADKERLQTYFREAMERQLSEEGGYQLVDTASDNVLEISAMMTRIAPNASKDDYRSRPAGRSKVFSEGAGKMDVSVTFSDSETGEVLALTKNSRSGSTLWGINNRVTNLAEVRRAFTSWAIQIRAQLNQVHSQE